MDLLEACDGLLSVTEIADMSAEVETTLYTVPVGKTLILTKALLKVAGDVGAAGVGTIGQDGAETDFVGTTNQDNLDAAGDVILMAPVPSVTPAKLKEYAAGTVIKYDQVTAGNAVAGTLYLYGTLDDA
jgi:hypothetical protein